VCPFLGFSCPDLGIAGSPSSNAALGREEMVESGEEEEEEMRGAGSTKLRILVPGESCPFW
jgi:hypothetical protein